MRKAFMAKESIAEKGIILKSPLWCLIFRVLPRLYVEILITIIIFLHWGMVYYMFILVERPGLESCPGPSFIFEMDIMKLMYLFFWWWWWWGWGKLKPICSIKGKKSLNRCHNSLILGCKPLLVIPKCIKSSSCLVSHNVYWCHAKMFSCH